MCPIPRDVLEQKRKQVEALFDEFMQLSSDYLSKGTTNEYDEKGDSSSVGNLQRDSGVASGEAKGTRPISRGSLTSAELEQYRKLNFKEKESGSEHVPIRPAAGAETQDTPNDEETPISDRRFSSSNGSARQRTLSTGPTEQQLHDAAIKIAEIGDEIEKKYGDRMEYIQAEITKYLRDAIEGISYKDLVQHMNQLVSEGDMSWTTFMIMFHVGKSVLLKLNRPIATEYFRRYMGHQYAEQVAQRDDVVQFVANDSPTSL